MRLEPLEKCPVCGATLVGKKPWVTLLSIRKKGLAKEYRIVGRFSALYRDKDTDVNHAQRITFIDVVERSNDGIQEKKRWVSNKRR